MAAAGTGNIAPYTAPVTNTSIQAQITTQTTLNGCTGNSETAGISVSPQPLMLSVPNTIVCAGATVSGITFSALPSGTSFNWTNNNAATGLANSGTGDISTYISPASTDSLKSTITVTPSLNGCNGAAESFVLLIKPTPTLNAFSGQNVCSGGVINGVNFQATPATASVNWTNNNTAIGLAAAGTGNIASYIAPNTGVLLNGSLTVTPHINGCTGNSHTETISISPEPTLLPLTNKDLCGGSTSAAIPFFSSPQANAYAWANSNPLIGLAASGTASIPAFQASNTSVTETGIITVIPSLNGCPGDTQIFLITVKPRPSVNTVSNGVFCSGSYVNSVVLTTQPVNTTSIWQSSNPSFGFPASGSGNIPGFQSAISATNSSTLVSAWTQLNGCLSDTIHFTYSLHATPVINSPSNITSCGGTSINALNLISTPAGASLSWTNNNAQIGLAATGTGNIPAFSVPYQTTAQQATIQINPVLNNCQGAPVSYTINIHANPQLNGAALIDTAECTLPNGGITGLTASGGTSPYQYQWYSGNTPIPGANQAALSNAGPGSYNLVVTDANNCNSSGLSSLIVIPSTPTIVANFSANPSGGSQPLYVNFDNLSSNASTYSWLIDNSFESSQFNFEHTFVNEGNYLVSLIAQKGDCSDTITKTITVDLVSEIEIPNIFTPNGDGINEVFTIKSHGLKEFDCRIYNRWGALVHTINTPGGIWDGKLPNGESASDGTYFYILKATGADGKKYKREGPVNIAR